jgi:hypothetical protein
MFPHVRGIIFFNWSGWHWEIIYFSQWYCTYNSVWRGLGNGGIKSIERVDLFCNDERYARNSITSCHIYIADECSMISHGIF